MRGEGIEVRQHEAPRRSWWVGKDREQCQQAQREQAERQRRNSRSTEGEAKIIGTNRGRI